MDTRAARRRIRQEWEQEAREDEEQERQIGSQVRKWKLRAALVGFAFMAACAGVVPFLAGHSLHNQWDAIGKKILLVAMGLFLPFLLVTMRWLIEWSYFRNIKKIDMRYAPPNIKYRKR